jgi:hypothetical protein
MTAAIRRQSMRMTLQTMSPTIAGATIGRSAAARSGSSRPMKSASASTGAARRPKASSNRIIPDTPRH